MYDSESELFVKRKFLLWMKLFPSLYNLISRQAKYYYDLLLFPYSKSVGNSTEKWVENGQPRKEKKKKVYA